MIAQQLRSLATHLEDPGFILRNNMGLSSKPWTSLLECSYILKEKKKDLKKSNLHNKFQASQVYLFSKIRTKGGP